MAAPLRSAIRSGCRAHDCCSPRPISSRKRADDTRSPRCASESGREWPQCWRRLEMTRSMLRTTVAFALLAGALPLTTARGQGNGVVDWSPRRPKQGAVFRLVVDGVSDPRAVSGTVAGEPLHFA